VVWAVLPMLLHDVILIRYFHFSLSPALGLLLWKNAQFGFFLLFAASLGVLTASFARALLLAIAAFVVANLTFYALQKADAVPVGSWTANYEMLAVLAVAAVGALGVVAFQYRFRITSVAAVIGVAVILVCALLARFWQSSLTAYLLQKNESPLLRSIQVLPDAGLKDIARPRDLPDLVTQARTAYYPFQASGLSDNVGVSLIGLTAHFDSPGQKPASFYLATAVHFQPQTSNSEPFAEVGSPDQLISFALPFPGDYDRLKDIDGMLSGNLVLQGFRSAVARVAPPRPGMRQDFAIGDRRCTVGSFLRGPTLVLAFDCVELEPGNTSQFKVRLLQDNREIAQSGGSGQSSSAGAWPAFLSPIVRTYWQSEFELPGVGLVGELPSGLEMTVFAEQNLGPAVRTFRIEHFRPADFSLQAWEQRGVVKAESTSTQSNSGIPKTQ
jgi:hypothetical protein